MVEFSNPAAYEMWMGRWSRRLAPLFVSFADLSDGGRLLDVGSGTGALCEALLDGVAGSTVVGIEPSEAYVLFWDTVLEVVPSEDAHREAEGCMAVDYPDETALRRLWRETGLVGVEAERQEIDMTFSDFGDYWSPFLSNVTPMSSYAGTLAADQVAKIEGRLRAKVTGYAAHGPFRLTAHAWAIRGQVPPL